MARDRRRARGDRGEDLAVEHLLTHGYEVVERNFRTRFGELDLVAADSDALVFCEVKTRLAGGAGGPETPLESVGGRKRGRVRLIAGQWLAARGDDRPSRGTLCFDAIGVTVTRHGDLVRLDHVEDAF